MKVLAVILCAAAIFQDATAYVQAYSGSLPANTTRFWNCCKPSCSWGGKGTTSPIQSCSKDGITVLDSGATNVCGDGGDSFVCNNQQPFVKHGIAYGWAGVAVGDTDESELCCACYELTFTAAPIKGKKMIVQAAGKEGGLAPTQNHFTLQIPGAGVATFTEGCQKQWNAPAEGWGKRFGGVASSKECNQLPKELRDGCKWRFGWFKGADNPSATFRPVQCPVELTSRSGCQRNNSQ